MRAIVIGAGIGGLAAGIGMTRAGIDVAVYEQADELREVGAGLALWANAVQALDLLGLGDAVRSVSTPYGIAGLRTWQGATITAPTPDLDRRLGVLCVVMHRAELLAALRERMAGRIHLSARCERFEQDAGGILAEFADGRRAHGDILIGADGLHSVVRAQLHGNRPPRYAGYTAWRSVVTFDAAAVQASESWGSGARFGVVPMSGGRVYWFATENAPEGGHHADEKTYLLRRFAGWHPPIEALILSAPASAVLRNDIYDRPVLRTWGLGRVTLLGDAAHPMTPNLGQGACQALEDAVVLARSLEASPDPAASLRSYEHQRIARTNWIVRQSRWVGTIGQQEHRLAIAARNALLRRIPPRVQARGLDRVVGFDWTRDASRPAPIVNSPERRQPRQH